MFFTGLRFRTSVHNTHPVSDSIVSAGQALSGSNDENKLHGKFATRRYEYKILFVLLSYFTSEMNQLKSWQHVYRNK